MEKTLTKDISVLPVQEFTDTPGPRLRKEGEHSGEEFREDLLRPRFEDAAEHGCILVVDLDGTAGYASSFLEEAFGGLARRCSIAAVQDGIEVKSDTRPWYIGEIEDYIREAKD